MERTTHASAAEVIADPGLTLEAKREILTRWHDGAPEGATDENLAEVKRALSHLQQDRA